MANYSIGTNLEPVTNVGSRSKAARKKRDEARKKAESAIEEAEGLAGGGALAIEQGAEKGKQALRGATSQAMAAAGGRGLGAALATGKERGLAEAQFEAGTAKSIQDAKEQAALNKLELSRASREMDEGAELKEDLRDLEQGIADAIEASTGFWGVDEEKARRLAKLELDKYGGDLGAQAHGEKFLDSALS